MRGDQILFWGTVSFIGGVGLGSFFAVRPESYLVLIAAWAAVAAVFQQKNVLIVGTLLFFFIIGTVHAAHTADHFRIGNMPVGEFSGTVRIVADPEDKNFFQQIIVRPESCESAYCLRDDILWQAPRTFAAEAGTRIAFSCALALPENFSPDFDYRMFLAKDGVGFVCKKAVRADKIAGSDMAGDIRAWLYRPKHAFEQALGKSISEPEAGLAKGLLLGGNSYLPEKLQTAFTRIGLTHIVAVSGYNITLIAQCLLLFGIAIGLWRKQAFWFAAVGIAVFVLMIGVPASAARAGVMAGIAFSAMHFGRLSRPSSVLCLAAALMLWSNPLLLRYDAGFQLSFLATLAIVEAATLESYFFPSEFFGKSLFELIWFSLAAELFVLPIILYQFHMFSPLMLLSNMAILPLVPYAMLFAFLSAALFLVSPGLQVVFSWTAYFFLSYMTRFAEWLGGLSWSNVEILGFASWMGALWYGVLFFAIVKARQYGRQKYHIYAFTLPRTRDPRSFLLRGFRHFVAGK